MNFDRVIGILGLLPLVYGVWRWIRSRRKPKSDTRTFAEQWVRLWRSGEIAAAIVSELEDHARFGKLLGYLLNAAMAFITFGILGSLLMYGALSVFLTPSLPDFPAIFRATYFAIAGSTYIALSVLAARPITAIMRTSILPLETTIVRRVIRDQKHAEAERAEYRLQELATPNVYVAHELDTKALAAALDPAEERRPTETQK